MLQRNNILQELGELNSQLVNITSENVYSVPAGYFDGLAATLLNRIKAFDAANAVEELNYLSASLSTVSKQIPYTVPVGYFEGLAEKAMQSIREGNDYQTAEEEIESLSPLLSGLRKENPYSVPQGYFENIERPQTKVVSLTHRKWFRYAAAAMVIGILTFSGIKYFNSRKVDVNDTDKWVAKNLKNEDPKTIDAFVTLVDGMNPDQKEQVINPSNTSEIKELMKDVPEKDIQDFVDETAGTEPISGSDDAIMN